MFRFIALIIAFIILIFAIVSKTNNNKTPKSTTNGIESIIIEKNRFIPTSLTISNGDTITITNKDSATHQVASDPHPSHDFNPKLNLNILFPGETATVTLTQKGNFGFHDEFNPGIKGKVIVE